MLELARAMDDYLIFYNGPKCGASAPDHMHFQAGTMASLSASAIDVVGAGFIKLTDAGIECFGIEVIQLLGTSQMSFCIFLGSADI